MGGLVKIGPAKKHKKIRYAHTTGECHYCRCTFEVQTRTSKRHETVDHKTPLSRGGTNHPTNRCRCCWQCNNDKGNMTEGEFRRYRATGVKPYMVSERELNRVPAYGTALTSQSILWPRVID